MRKYRLRSFMFHAGFLTEDGGWDARPIHEQEDNFKRFAELIIWECINTVIQLQDDTDRQNWPTPYGCAEAISEHFGVEE